MAPLLSVILLVVAAINGRMEATRLPALATLEAQGPSRFYRQLRDIIRNKKARDFEQEEQWPTTSVDSLVEVEDWPPKSVLEGLLEVPGVAVDNSGLVHIFHRGDRTWDSSTFNANGIYQHRKRGPIPNNTVIALDPDSGNVKQAWGRNRFYLPHGISLDANNNTWVTDIALHQVFKFEPGRYAEPSLVLGEAFQPGVDHYHFCKPTHALASSSGTIFVSDGYCNSRILMFREDGHFIKQFGIRGPVDMMLVPHMMTLFEEQDLLCVADRENYRVLCFSAGRSGPAGFQQLLLNRPPIGRVFGVDRLGDYLFAVNGPAESNQDASLQRPYGFVMDLRNKNLINYWAPKKGFVMPHGIAVAPDGSAVYVTEVGVEAPKKIYKFVPQK